MPIADFYGRKSNKDDGRSVASQEKDFRADCVEQGYEVGRLFADPDRSASRYARRPRPDYAELLAHIRGGECELLSLWEASRGSRDLGDWVALLDLCRKHGVLIRVITHGRTYDVRRRRDWRTLADEGVDSADESEKISERTRRGKRDAAAAGRPVARRAYGFRRVYDPDSGRVVTQVPDPEQAPIVREIVEALAADPPIAAGELARRLNGRGVPAPMGGRWTDKQVRQIAIKPSYAGLRVHRGEVVGDAVWEPLVDPAVWRVAHDRLTAPGRKPVPDSRLSHWLTGAVRCGLCGHTLRAVNRPSGVTAYQCRACFRVSASTRGLEAFLEPVIRGRLRQADVAQLFVPRPDDAAIRAAIAVEGKLQRRLDEFRAEGRKPDGLSAAAVAEAERGLMPLIEAARAKVRRLSLPPTLAELAGVDIPERWPGLRPYLRREVVKALADVVLAPGTARDGPRFDEARLAGSRWIGDEKTWGEHWAEAGS